jgi:hypothetical protein
MNDTVLYAKQLNLLQSVRKQLFFLSPLFMLFDDYWYYVYHDNNLTNLVIIPTFLNFMYEANQDRLFPNFINT